MDTYEIEKKRGKIVDLSKISIKKIRELIVFTALLVVLGNLLADVLYAVFDPRIRKAGC